MITTTTLYDMLEKHDWYFDCSDDPHVWKQGSRDLELIQLTAKKLGEPGRDLLTNYRMYITTCNSVYPTPKPYRPTGRAKNEHA